MDAVIVWPSLWLRMWCNGLSFGTIDSSAGLFLLLYVSNSDKREFRSHFRPQKCQSNRMEIERARNCVVRQCVCVCLYLA